MNIDEIVIFFDELPIRKYKIKNQWWISAIDTAKAIGYSNPARDANRIININKHRFANYTISPVLGSIAKDGIEYKRKILLLNLSGVIAFCLLSKHVNAIPLQRWADEVLAKHIDKYIYLYSS